MVGGERQHEAVLAGKALGDHGGGDQGGAGIPARGLERHRGLDADLAGLAAGEEAEILVGDDEGGREQAAVGYALQRLLIERTAAGERLELLRQTVARDRPKPRTAASSQYHRHDRRSTQHPYCLHAGEQRERAAADTFALAA